MIRTGAALLNNWQIVGWLGGLCVPDGSTMHCFG